MSKYLIYYLQEDVGPTDQIHLPVVCTQRVLYEGEAGDILNISRLDNALLAIIIHVTDGDGDVVVGPPPAVPEVHAPGGWDAEFMDIFDHHDDLEDVAPNRLADH